MREFILALLNDVVLPITLRVLTDNPNATDADVYAALEQEVAAGVKLDDMFLRLKEQIQTGQI